MHASNEELKKAISNHSVQVFCRNPRVEEVMKNRGFKPAGAPGRIIHDTAFFNLGKRKENLLFGGGMIHPPDWGKKMKSQLILLILLFAAGFVSAAGAQFEKITKSAFLKLCPRCGYESGREQKD